MNKRRVVIIEAERLTTLYYNNIFTRLNFEHVNHISYSTEIISNLRILKPDFILMDVALLDEHVAVSILDKLYYYDSEKPLAVVSSLFSPEIIKKLKSFTSSEFFLKPLDMEKFSSQVEKSMEGKLNNKQLQQNINRQGLQSSGVLKRLINLIF